MREQRKKDAKKRIYEASLRLFARKGFDAVGIREIAKIAGVNSSMINYYFGGKVGVLKAMIEDCYKKYYNAIWIKDAEKMSVEEHVRVTIDHLIDFFRENMELAMVAFNTMPYNLPEIMDLKLKLVAERRSGTNEFFKKLGLDTGDVIKMSVVRGLLTSIVGDHFQFRHTQENVLRLPGKSGYARAPFLEETKIDLNDEYYRQYSEILMRIYLYGVKNISKGE